MFAVCLWIVISLSHGQDHLDSATGCDIAGDWLLVKGEEGGLCRYDLPVKMIWVARLCSIEDLWLYLIRARSCSWTTCVTYLMTTERLSADLWPNSVVVVDCFRQESDERTSTSWIYVLIKTFVIFWNLHFHTVSRKLPWPTVSSSNMCAASHCGPVGLEPLPSVLHHIWCTLPFTDETSNVPMKRFPTLLILRI